MPRFYENRDFRVYPQPNKRSGKLNCRDHILRLCMPVNNNGGAEGARCAFLTVHGEFLRGGGKRGLLRTAGLRCPLAWPPSTEKVTPKKYKHKCAESDPNTYAGVNT